MNLKTRIRSTAMRYLSSERYQVKQQTKARKARERQGEPPVVHYFHQVDDPFSHLAVQKLDTLRAAYNLPFTAHLAAKPTEDFQGSAEHFDTWARTDAGQVAEPYGTTFPANAIQPTAPQIATANAKVAPALNSKEFASLATEVGTALWQGNTLTGGGHAEDAIADGTRLRTKLGHYQGGMFYFDGEWYWGIDRIRLLEERLIAEGFANDPRAGILVPQPTPQPMTGSAEHITLEYFPSLRSPYTAIGHARVVDLVKRTGVNLKARPVMPMLMRGVKAPQAKQRYIITDAAREGRAFGSPLGKIVDPFGEPVRRAFALYPAAAQQGRGLEYITAYLQAAWVDGTDVTKKTGLQSVAENAGIAWQTFAHGDKSTTWKAVLQANLEEMLEESLWGVPSFRLTSGGRTTSSWGQDRIWQIENEITQRSQEV